MLFGKNLEFEFYSNNMRNGVTDNSDVVLPREIKNCSYKRVGRLAVAQAQ